MELLTLEIREEYNLKRELERLINDNFKIIAVITLNRKEYVGAYFNSKTQQHTSVEEDVMYYKILYHKTLIGHLLYE